MMTVPKGTYAAAANAERCCMAAPHLPIATKALCAPHRAGSVLRPARVIRIAQNRLYARTSAFASLSAVWINPTRFVLTAPYAKRIVESQTSLIADRLKRSAVVRGAPAQQAWGATRGPDCAMKSLLASRTVTALSNSFATKRRVGVMTQTAPAALTVTVRKR